MGSYPAMNLHEDAGASSHGASLSLNALSALQLDERAQSLSAISTRDLIQGWIQDLSLLKALWSLFVLASSLYGFQTIRIPDDEQKGPVLTVPPLVAGPQLTGICVESFVFGFSKS